MRLDNLAMLLQHFSIVEIGLGPSRLAIQKRHLELSFLVPYSKALSSSKCSTKADALDLMPFEGRLGELCARLGILFCFSLS